MELILNYIIKILTNYNNNPKKNNYDFFFIFSIEIKIN